MKDTKNGVVSPKLPKKVSFNLSELDYEEEDLQDDEIIGEIIGDYLSDTYGFCLFGFLYEIKGNKVYCSKIDWDTTE